MVKRWKVTQPGTTPGREDGIEVVPASDYDALAVKFADADSDRERWHKAFLDAKYPTVLPTRVDLEARIAKLEAAANEVLRVYMPQFNDSRTVDDCLVGLAAAVAGVPCSNTKPVPPRRK